jgi:hypothetical protein
MGVEPIASRPYMPDYGIVPADQGMGLLPWSWAEEQLRTSHNFWLATRWPDGRPHAVPVWAIWDGSDLWFSGGLHSRKVLNLLADGRGVVTTEDARNPVIVEGVATKLEDDPSRQHYLDLTNDKYGTDCQMDFLDPATTAVFRLRPVWAFGLREDDFTGSPTRWRLIPE